MLSAGVVLARTKAVVANCWVLVPAVAVGAVGTPVKIGESDKTTLPDPVESICESVTVPAKFVP